MIVLRGHKAIVLTPPKCASTSLHYGLCSVGGIWGIGPQGDGEYTPIGNHTLCVPEEFLCYTKYLVVRNPYDRLVSLYFEAVRWHAKQGDPGPSFAEYARSVASGQSGLGWFHDWTIARHVQEARLQYDALIRFESLQSDLEALVGDVSLPDLNVSYREPWKYYYDRWVGLLREVQPWATEDTRQFGFKLNSKDHT